MKQQVSLEEEMSNENDNTGLVVIN
jgi:hypothetical protein